MNNIDQMLADANAQAQTFSQEPQQQNHAQVQPDAQQQMFQQAQAQQQYQQQQQQQYQPQQQQQQQYQPQQQQQYQPQQQAQQAQQAPAVYQQAPAQNQAQVPAQQQPAAAQLPAHLQQYATPQTFTMESMAGMGLSVEQWFKPDYQGMTIGDHDAIVREAIVEIDMTENVGFVLGMGIRYGNPAIYHFTTDGASCQDGMSWPMAMATAVSVDPTAKPFRSVQIPMVALEDIVDVDGNLVSTAGTCLGYTTPYSGWNTWFAFHRLCGQKGLLGQRVAVRITNEPKKNAAGNKWGNLRYELYEGPAAETQA